MVMEECGEAASLNMKRIEQGRQAVAGYNGDWDEWTNLIDLLADVMHWAASEGLSFDEALRIARNHFAAEAEDEATARGA
jgi:hypothetical protein